MRIFCPAICSLRLSLAVHLSRVRPVPSDPRGRACRPRSAARRHAFPAVVSGSDQPGRAGACASLERRPDARALRSRCGTGVAATTCGQRARVKLPVQCRREGAQPYRLPSTTPAPATPRGHPYGRPAGRAIYLRAARRRRGCGRAGGGRLTQPLGRLAPPIPGAPPSSPAPEAAPARRTRRPAGRQSEGPPSRRSSGWRTLGARLTARSF